MFLVVVGKSASQQQVMTGCTDYGRGIMGELHPLEEGGKGRTRMEKASEWLLQIDGLKIRFQATNGLSSMLHESLWARGVDRYQKYGIDPFFWANPHANLQEFSTIVRF